MIRLLLPALLLSACGPATGNLDGNDDSDGDGILNSEEEQLGTDPLDADTDGDGYTDSEERDSYTDPLDPDDYPYTYQGGWPVDSCRLEVQGTGTAEGDVAYNFELMDQFGDMVNLYDFCAHSVYLLYGEWESS